LLNRRFSLTAICEGYLLTERQVKNMNLKHRVRINVTGKNGTKEMVLSGGETKIRSGFLDRLLGDNNCVLILRLGASVADVEVMEVPEGGEEDAT
jgi:hypothetical protein